MTFYSPNYKLAFHLLLLSNYNSLHKILFQKKYTNYKMLTKKDLLKINRKSPVEIKKRRAAVKIFKIRTLFFLFDQKRRRLRAVNKTTLPVSGRQITLSRCHDRTMYLETWRFEFVYLFLKL